MYLSDQMPTLLLANIANKQCNILNINNLGGIAQQIIHRTYFDLAQHKYLRTIFSDATQGHLTDVSCLVGKTHSIQIPM